MKNNVINEIRKEIENGQQWRPEFAVTHFEKNMPDIVAAMKRLGIETRSLEESFSAARELRDSDDYPYDSCREFDGYFTDRLVDAVNEMAEKRGDDPLPYMDLPL